MAKLIDISDKGPKLSDLDVYKLEGDFGETLPDDFKAFLMANNGGTPRPDCIYIKGLSGSPTDVQEFFGIGTDIESSDIYWNLDLIRQSCPNKKLLPIAVDSGGNFFLLDYTSSNGLQISYLEIDDGMGELYNVASSFSEFLSKITQFDG
jgi:cell wall assembly regulator SMI1